MRGVVYLVIEEAHLFAPKERSGIGAENLSIHWAKTMATAGRSKGVRLVLVTQRTQALHNALLGSCDTLIAHRLTAPADQDPVVKWLKANTSKDVLEQVSGSLASLKTGEAWVCSGEAKLFERVHFPRISTYDNTATPTGDISTREIKTAAVDQEKLRAMIGDAVEKAKADDPRELRKQLAEAQRMLVRQEKAIAELQARTPVGREKRIEVPVLKDGQLARVEKLVERFGKALDVAMKQHAAICEPLQQLVSGVHAIRRQQEQPAPTNTPQRSSGSGVRPIARTDRPAPRAVSRPVSIDTATSNGNLGGPELKILRALSELEAVGLHPADKQQLGLMAGYTNVRSGGFSEPLGRVIGGGYATSPATGMVAITDAGRAAVGEVSAPQTTEELQERLMAKLTGPEQKLLRALLERYPDRITKEELGAVCGYTNIRSGGIL